MDGLLNYLIFAELLSQAEETIANKRKREANQLFDNALIDPDLRHVVKCPWQCSEKENLSLIKKIKIPYSGTSSNKEAIVKTILRFVFEKEAVGTLKDILKNERKKREDRGGSGDSSEVFIPFASKDDVVNELMTKHWRTCTIRIDYDNERKAMLGYKRDTISNEELLGLVNIGLDLNFRHPITKQTFLHLVAMQDLKPAVKFLIDKGTDPNLPDAWGYLPLHDAIDKSMFGNAMMLIPHTKLNYRDEKGVAPLHLAVLRQSPAVVTELLKFHADPNPRLKNSGYTPLHLSLMKENNTIPKLLLQNGADPNIQPLEGLSSQVQNILSELRVLYLLLGSTTEKEYPTVLCDGCQVSPFSGLRSHCTVCYDYDLCPNCAILGITSKDHLASHTMDLRCINKTDKVMAQWRLMEELQQNRSAGRTIDVTIRITRTYDDEQKKIKEIEDKKNEEEEKKKRQESEKKAVEEKAKREAEERAKREAEEKRKREEETKKKEEAEKVRKQEEDKKREEEAAARRRQREKEVAEKERLTAEKYAEEQRILAEKRIKQYEQDVALAMALQEEENRAQSQKKSSDSPAASGKAPERESVFWKNVREKRAKNKTRIDPESVRPTMDVKKTAYCKTCEKVDHTGDFICPNCRSSLALHNRWVYVELIGEGGCGKVYKAADLQTFNSYSVIKILREPSAADSARHSDQFKKEAKALQMLGTLHIPINVPKLISFIEEDPICLVEEYIPGFALGEEMMDMKEANYFFISMLRTLKTVHAKGLLHRDLKPENFMYSTAADKYYLIDFGIVKLAKSSNVYLSQDAKGTLDYMAPEVQTGSLATAASDIYSLGVTMYQLLTGKTSPTPQEIQYYIYESLFVKVLAKMVQKDPTKRYQNVDEVLVEFFSTTVDGVDVIDYNSLNLSKFLGSGSYGEVYMGTWQCETVAVKQLSVSALTRDSLAEFKKEVEIWKSLLPRYVVNLYGICDKPPKLCMVMEYMPNGSLWNVLHDSSIELDYDLKLQLVLEVACAMRHLHQRKVYHRDLKSQNIVINRKYEAKLCDFGFSIVKKETRSQSRNPNVAGTLQWTAPEVLALLIGTASLRTSKKDVYDIYAKADVYSFGVVMWEILTRQVPHDNVLCDARILINAQLEIPEDTPVEYATLMVKCLARNPEERPTFVEIVAELESSFNLNYDEASLPSTPRPSFKSSASSSSSSSQTKSTIHVPQTTKHQTPPHTPENKPSTPKSNPKSSSQSAKPASQPKEQKEQKEQQEQQQSEQLKEEAEQGIEPQEEANEQPTNDQKEAQQPNPPAAKNKTTAKDQQAKTKSKEQVDSTTTQATDQASKETEEKKSKPKVKKAAAAQAPSTSSSPPAQSTQPTQADPPKPKKKKAPAQPQPTQSPPPPPASEKATPQQSGTSTTTTTAAPTARKLPSVPPSAVPMSMPAFQTPKPTSYVPPKAPTSFQHVKFCTGCGTPRPPDGKFCGECGKKF